MEMYIEYICENRMDVDESGGWEKTEWDPCGDEVAKFRWSVVRQIISNYKSAYLDMREGLIS